MPKNVSMRCRAGLHLLAWAWFVGVLAPGARGDSFEPTNPAAVPVQQAGWAERHAQKVEAIAHHKYDLLMIGDSITHNLDNAPMKAVWDQYFAPRNAIDLGYSGARTENILFNLQHGELEGQSPKVAVLLIGTNNTDDANYPVVSTPQQVAGGTEAIIRLLREKCPRTKIIVLRIFPRQNKYMNGETERGSEAKRWTANLKASELVRKLCDGTTVRFLDLNYLFLRLDGTIDPNLMTDLLHPSPAGALLWAKAMDPILAELMGEPRLDTDVETNSALVPASKLETDSYDWFLRHNQVLKEEQTANPQIVMIGDSITHFWGGEPKAKIARGPLAWENVFAGRPVLNLGFGWDRTQNVLWRLDHGEFDGIHPRFAVINIGTNNLAGTVHARENTPAEIAQAVEAICIRVRSKSPDSKIILMGVFPRGQRADDPFRAKITAINELLAKLGEVPGITFLDIGPQFLGPDGSISHDLMGDFLHPTEKGYAIWAAALKRAMDGNSFMLGNKDIQATWQLDDNRLVLTQLKDLVNDKTVTAEMPAFTLQLGDGSIVSAASLKPVGTFHLTELAADPKASVLAERFAGKAVEVRYQLPAQKLAITWRAILRDGSDYIRQEIALTPEAESVVIRKLTLISLALPDAKVFGSVQGSPITTSNLFLGIEHPVASSRIGTPMQWSPANFQRANASTELSFNLDGTVSAPADYEFAFQYTGGAHRLDVTRVEIVADGKVVAADEHHGFAGAPSQANVYKLNLPAFDKSSRYTLEVQGFTDQGIDSNGLIIATKDGQSLGAARAECSFSRGVPLPAGQPWSLSSVIGVAPPGQMRRAFNGYLDRERAHPYRQFPHYNSWYDLNIDRPDCRMTETEMLKSLDAIGNELTTKRGVKLASFVMDDGWDSRNTVWDFNDGFPQGFTNVARAAARYDAGIGLWMSPWGGYGGRDQRIAAGRPFGYETNGNGFSMAGKKYRAHFLETGLRMIRDYHANFFKFDGMGGGAMSDGGDNAYANDMDAIIGVCGDLRKAEPDLFISATVGTWPSPFWLRYVDSIWRQGDDAGLAGVGNGRERWITYRDATVYSRIVQRGPLYPIQSLMVHGIIIGERGIPAQMDRTDESVEHEARSFFGTGTDLQELYLTPHLLTSAMWDSIAESAKWAHSHADCLVDSHWIGGNPGALEVYGFAGWIPGKGVLTLRNPSDKPQVFDLDIGTAFELPRDHTADVYVLTSPWPEPPVQSLTVVAGQPQAITLPPFAVFNFDATVNVESGKNR